MFDNPENYTSLDRAVDEIALRIDEGKPAVIAITEVKNQLHMIDPKLNINQVLEYFEETYRCNPATYQENYEDDIAWAEENGITDNKKINDDFSKYVDDLDLFDVESVDDIF